MKMKLSVQMIYRVSIEIDVDQETFDLLEQFDGRRSHSRR